jgi:archaeal flagellin FlaB
MDMKKPHNRGTTGIGMLIIFIAVIVVSAVAAAVLIGAGGSLEQRSLSTMKGTEQEVASGLSIYSIIGSDGSVDGTLNNLEMLVKLRPGSDPVSLNSTVITIDGRISSQMLRYTDGTATAGEYTVYYLRRGGSALPGYINLGDSAVINISLTTPIGPDEKLVIQIIPAQGGVRRIGFTTPNVVVDKRVFLFP